MLLLRPALVVGVRGLNDDVSFVGISLYSWMLGGVVIGVGFLCILNVDQVRTGLVHTTDTNF
jgi:hypothetical protein